MPPGYARTAGEFRVDGGRRWGYHASMFRSGVPVILALTLIPALSCPVEAGEDDSLEDELEELEEDDFPDLVGSEEDGDIMDEFALLHEEEIVFTAARHKQDILESPSSVTVITREQIENTHCTDVVCLLRLVPEVDVRRVLPMYAIAGARALNGERGNQTLVLIDGREINVEIYGFPYWQSMAVHLEDIQRIEVIRGPGSALYGANAHSMVVSIFTRPIEENFGEAFVGGGEHGRTSVHARLGRIAGEWRLHVAGGYEGEGNWQERGVRERSVGRFRLQADHVTDSSTLSIQGGLTTPVGLNFLPFGPMDTTHSYQGHASATYQRDFLRAQVSLALNGADFVLDYPLYYGKIKLGELPRPMDFFNSALDAEAQLTWEPFEGNLLIGGGNYRWITLLSDVLEPGTVHQHRVGLFVHDEQRLGDAFLITGGLRLDYNTITPFTVSPRLAASWRFVDDQLVRLAFGRAFRKPAFFETSTHFKGVKPEPGFEELEDFFLRSFGNEDLGNESVTAFEVGYRGRFLGGTLVVEADAFLHLYRDTILFTTDMKTGDFNLPDLSESEMLFRNEGRDVNSVGGSVAITYRVKETLWITANYTGRHSWYVSDPATSDIAFGGKGDRVSWEPAHMLNLAAHYLTERGLRIGLSLHGSTERINSMPENAGFFDDWVAVRSPASIFVNAFFSYRLGAGSGWLEAGVRAFNLLQVEFRDSESVVRQDGTLAGGEYMGRRVILFLRGCL